MINIVSNHILSRRRKIVNHRAKSFVAGLAGGISGAVEVLDVKVASLGDIIIHDLKDIYYTSEQNGPNGSAPGPRVVRVVVYSFNEPTE